MLVQYTVDQQTTLKLSDQTAIEMNSLYKSADHSIQWDKRKKDQFSGRVIINGTAGAA